MTAPDIPRKQSEAFCKKRQITELALSGSVLREDFSADSDIDIMVTFAPDAPWSCWDWPDITEDLDSLFRHAPVDLVEKNAVTNPFIRHRVFTTRKVLFAA